MSCPTDDLVPVIQKKAEWALRYITPDLVSLLDIQCNVNELRFSHSA